MKIENAELVVPIRRMQPTATDKAPPASQSAGQPQQNVDATRAVQPAPQTGEADVQTYTKGRKPPPPAPEEHPPEVPNRPYQQIAKLTRLWSEFREAGIIRPPRSYAGLKVITPAELLEAESDPLAVPGKLSVSDEMRMQLVRNLLQQARSSGQSPPQQLPPGGPPV
ncbi:MAG: hypothetical protein ACOC93_05400 [Planctomycetota bacterium]